MKMVLRTAAAVAMAFALGLTGSVHAQESASPSGASVGPPAGAPQDVRATVLTPEGGPDASAAVRRQQVRLRDGGTVSVLRPVATKGASALGRPDDVPRETQLAWQVVAGRRLWLIDPVSGDLRTCAVRQTSTVGVEAIRCFAVSGAFAPTLAP